MFRAIENFFIGIVTRTFSAFVKIGAGLAYLQIILFSTVALVILIAIARMIWNTF